MFLRVALMVHLFVLLLSGCSSNRIEVLEADISDLRSIQARQGTSISEMRQDLQALQGAVEELEHVSSHKTLELEQKLRRFGTRVPPPAGVPARLLREDEERIASVSGGAAAGYKKALAQLRSGEFENARKVFQSFVDENPETAFTDNALFWIGVSFENLGRYDRAIVAYSDVFQLYPAENRVPDALYRLSEAFAKIDSLDEAILTMQKLIDEHPKSAVASKARLRVKELRKTQHKRRR